MAPTNSRRVMASWPLVLLAAAAFASANAQDAALVAADEPVAGHSQKELSVMWWQWAWSFDPADSPIRDRSGSRCGARQEGPVWFLAGTYGTARVVRTCRVPAGKTLFFPLVNYVVYAPPGSRRGCMALMAEAASRTDDPAALVLELNGVRIDVTPSHRQGSAGCFNLEARQPQPEGLGPAAANGYYVALKPLPKGTHTLNFGAILPSIQQAVTYTLVVD